MRSNLIAMTALGALGGTAGAAPAGAPESEVDLVSPMRVTVGKTLTIRGGNFSSRRRSNTVVFIAPNKQTVFGKPLRAGRSRLVVRVPAAVERLLSRADEDGAANPTRLAIRVIVDRRYGKRSIRRHSPVVVSSLSIP